jgi:hypothetical protein
MLGLRAALPFNKLVKKTRRSHKYMHMACLRLRSFKAVFADFAPMVATPRELETTPETQNTSEHLEPLRILRE